MLQSSASSQGHVGRKQKIAVLGFWFVLLIGMRAAFGYFLHDVWIGTVGTVAITFLVFYASLRYTGLQRYRAAVNYVLLRWYRKKFFLVSAAVTMVIFSTILAFIQYGYSHYADKLVTVTIGVDETGRIFSPGSFRSDGLAGYSPAGIAAITVASADKSMNGYYSKIVMYMLAEDAEITVFLLVMRGRKEIFPEARPR